MQVGDLVRVVAPKAIAHHWRGTVVADPAPACCQVQGTVLVVWAESEGVPVRYPLDRIEPIPPPYRSILLLAGNNPVSEALVRYAIARSPWEAGHIAAITDQTTYPAAISCAQAIKLPHQAFARLDQLFSYWEKVAKFPPAVIAISDGTSRDDSREAMVRCKQRQIDSQVFRLSEAAEIEVYNLKSVPADVPGLTYIGRDHPPSGNRRSPLCNPFSVDDHGRSGACDLFRTNKLYPALDQRSGEIWQEVDRLADRVLVGEPVNLLCHCVPAECHGHDVAMAIGQVVKERLGIEV